MSTGQRLFQSRIIMLRRIIFSAALALAWACAPSAGQASSYATAYDMSIFLNQSHPFDTGAVQQTYPSGTMTTTTGVEPMLLDDESDDDLFEDDHDDMNDLLAEDAGDPSDGDPLEPMNRFIFGFNSYLNDFLLSPLAHGYNSVVPEVVRDSFSSFLGNLSSPVVLANDLMQLEFGRAYRTFERMLVNSTIGIFGLWDAAGWMGLEAHDEDFGQTLGAYGVGEGIYLVLPIFGPSNPRDAIGKFGVDPFLDPVGLWLKNTDQDDWYYARAGAEGFTGYAEIVDQLDTLEETSMDFYAAVRSFYRQKREAEILNQDGMGGAMMSTGGLDEEFDLDDM